MGQQTYEADMVEELDGVRSYQEYVEPREEVLLALMRDLFETHWSKIVLGPWIPVAVCEIRLSEPPKEANVLDS